MAGVEKKADLILAYSVQTQQRGDVFGFTFEIDNGESLWCSPWIKVDGATSHDEAHIEARRQGRAIVRALHGESTP